MPELSGTAHAQVIRLRSSAKDGLHSRSRRTIGAIMVDPPQLVSSAVPAIVAGRIVVSIVAIGPRVPIAPFTPVGPWIAVASVFPIPAMVAVPSVTTFWRNVATTTAAVDPAIATIRLRLSLTRRHRHPDPSEHHRESREYPEPFAPHSCFSQRSMRFQQQRPPPSHRSKEHGRRPA